MKKFFLSRSPRERVLLLLFGVIALGWWAPSAIGRLSGLRREVADYNTEHDTQQLWLSRRAEIEARATAAGRTLDPAKTLDASQAFAELSRMASGLSPEIAAQKTERAEQFALHNVQVTIRRADLAGLYHFYEQVNARVPYLGVEQCVISADRANPGLHNAVFRVYSIEALKPEK